MVFVDVDQVVSADAFDEWLGGQVFTGPMKLAPDMWNLHAKPALQYALDRFLASLNRRVPPILYSDLQDPTELRFGVMYGAAEHLYQLAMTSGQFGDLYMEQRKLWAEKFDAEITGFVPTLSGGLRGPSALTIAVLRR
jgi:hypothetical protein